METTVKDFHTTINNATHAQIFESISTTRVGTEVQVEYNKIPSQKNLTDIVDKMYADVEKLSVKELINGDVLPILKNNIKKIKGDYKSETYYTTAECRNPSGYLLFTNGEGGYKSVNIGNVISFTINGVKYVR